MTKIIGLTGGIGSGKSTIAIFFNELGIPVYIADEEAKRIMQSPEIVERIKKTFGDGVFENEVLDRTRLAAIVFNDANKLTELNKIIHPAVNQDFKQWLIKHKKYSHVVYEAAILFESGRYKDCDIVITVSAPEKIRIDRVVKRDNTTPEQVLSRIKMQWKDEERISKSDFVINNESIKIAKEEVLKILKILNIKQKES
ncbi:dephospho-CoA kinase [Flavobacterium piscis]|uniref:Dephospho-CoA kinase n=1 Tax=Flavobacterium piscis TaxID=1114874 RepID=A0ABU1Y7U4_9FLAO|nr:dephospho-CoA kinase [Flavobacterium piscis]MDR7210168.1 dephospho-CoA kinase [Flavobacterium piscis]